MKQEEAIRRYRVPTEKDVNSTCYVSNESIEHAKTMSKPRTLLGVICNNKRWYVCEIHKEDVRWCNEGMPTTWEYAVMVDNCPNPGYAHYLLPKVIYDGIDAKIEKGDEYWDEDTKTWVQTNKEPATPQDCNKHYRRRRTEAVWSPIAGEWVKLTKPKIQTGKDKVAWIEKMDYLDGKTVQLVSRGDTDPSKLYVYTERCTPTKLEYWNVDPKWCTESEYPKLELGSYVKIQKPKMNQARHTSWVSDMDHLDGSIVKVQSLSDDKTCFMRNGYTIDSTWCTLIHSLKDLAEIEKGIQPGDNYKDYLIPAPNPGEGYRILHPKELLETGDEFYHVTPIVAKITDPKELSSFGWSKTFTKSMEQSPGCWYRRRVKTPPKPTETSSSGKPLHILEIAIMCNDIVLAKLPLANTNDSKLVELLGSVSLKLVKE